MCVLSISFSLFFFSFSSLPLMCVNLLAITMFSLLRLGFSFSISDVVYVKIVIKFCAIKYIG